MDTGTGWERKADEAMQVPGDEAEEGACGEMGARYVARIAGF